MRQAKACGVIWSRRRHRRISPATPAGAEGKGTLAETCTVKLVYMPTMNRATSAMSTQVSRGKADLAGMLSGASK
jgi:hypothetical protein